MDGIDDDDGNPGGFGGGEGGIERAFGDERDWGAFEPEAGGAQPYLAGGFFTPQT